MAYEVTATKRRPQKFGDLVGQDFVSATIKNAVQSEKSAHAYLFSGPRGCGKTSTARILAKALNCQNSKDGEPCGQCSSCVEITKASSLDVIEIDGASNTSVNDIRQIKDEILFPPNNSKYKIYIIDEVHMLSMSAFNALLKTIEEPPPYIIFIFATTEIHKVPATIKSRCQHFNFRLVSFDQIKNLLQEAAQEQNITAEDEALFWIARESTGSIRDAYTLFDQVVAFSENHITYEKIRDTLGLIGIEYLNTLYEFCVDGNIGKAISFFDELMQKGISIEQFVINSTEFVRSLLFIQAGVQKEALLGQSLSRYSKKILSAWNAQKLEHALDLFLKAFRDMRYSIDPRFDVEVVISKLASLTKHVSLDELQQTLNSAKALLLANQGDLGNGFTGNADNSTAGGFSPFDQSGCNQSVSVAAQSLEDDDKPVTASSFADLKAHLENQSKSLADNRLAKKQEEQEEENPSIVDYEKATNLDTLKDLSIQFISKQKSSISSALLGAKNWKLENEELSLEVETSYLYNLLNREKSYVLSVFNQFWQSTLKIEIAMCECKEAVQEKKSVPLQVELLCSVFKGEQIEK
ncbi:MAG: DNA polymerase III subunit gamma/tau [Treponemataceae bacterium]